MLKKYNNASVNIQLIKKQISPEGECIFRYEYCEKIHHQKIDMYIKQN